MRGGCGRIYLLNDAMLFPPSDAPRILPAAGYIGKRYFALDTKKSADRFRPMKLNDYLSARGETQWDFAARAGIYQSAVSRLLNGGDLKGRHWAKIALATGGAVRPEDHWPPARPRKRSGKRG